MRLNNYNDLADWMQDRDKKKLANNTWAERKDDNTIAIRLHSTDVLTFKPAEIIVDTGGWRTVTSKDRINRYLPGPYRIVQRNNEWFWCYWHDGRQEVIGMFIDKDTLSRSFTAKSGWSDWALHGGFASREGKALAKRHAELRKRIVAYAKLCASKVPMPPPDKGDCWYCLFKNDAGKSWGDMSGTDHLVSHMREKHVVPSLVMSALQEKRTGDIVIATAFGKGIENLTDLARAQVKQSVIKYLSRRFGLVQ